MQNLRMICTANGDLTKHQQEKHRVRSVVPLGDGSPGRKTDLPVSLLEEERFFSRLLTRETSRGFSSRVYYRAAGRVPFEWEIAPGKPKNSSESCYLPSLSPPPSLHSHLLPLNPRRESPRFRFFSLVRRKAGSRTYKSGDCGGGVAKLFERERIPITPDDCSWEFPAAAKKDLRWSEAGRIGCFPFGLKSIFLSAKGRRLS